MLHSRLKGLHIGRICLPGSHQISCHCNGQAYEHRHISNMILVLKCLMYLASIHRCSYPGCPDRWHCWGRAESDTAASHRVCLWRLCESSHSWSWDCKSSIKNVTISLCLHVKFELVSNSCFKIVQSLNLSHLNRAPYPFAPFIHRPPFWHGCPWHSSVLFSHRCPWKPAGQVQVKPPA